MTLDDWIPCRLQLPAEGMRVFFWLIPSHIRDHPGVLCVGTYERNRDEAGRHRWLDEETDGHGDRLEWRTGEVTHWMFLPDGPERVLVVAGVER